MRARSLQGFGVRISTPCRQQFDAIIDVLSRAPMSHPSEMLKTRSKDLFCKFTCRGIFCPARNEVRTAQENYTAKLNQYKKTLNGSNTSPFSLKLRLLDNKRKVLQTQAGLGFVGHLYMQITVPSRLSIHHTTDRGCFIPCPITTVRSS